MNRKQKIYYGIFFACLVLSIFMTAKYGLDLLRSQVLFYDEKDAFMDYFNSLKHSSISRPYDYGVFYPPICYLLYKVFALFIPYRIVDAGGEAIRGSSQGMASFIIYTCIFSALLVIVLVSFCKDKKTKILTSVAVITSAPFMFLYERGNLVLPTFILTVVFFMWMDDKKAWKREAALVALAVAFGFKIYPAIFGFVLLKDKKYKEAVRCSVYALVLFAVPFLFMGGFDAIISWISGLNRASGGGGLYMGPGCRTSFKNTIEVFIVTLITQRRTAASVSAAGIISYITIFAGAAAAFLTKDRIRCITVLCCIMIGFPSLSYQYMLVFMAIPLILFLEQKEEKGLYDYIVLILYIFMNVVLVLNVRQVGGKMKGQHDISILHLAEGTALFLMTWVVSIRTFADRIKGLKSRKIPTDKDS